ncbi:MAG: hypothetical protein CMG01_01535 [Candidatus Marinimicrobia bacterium]|nr:hypothetical protein [Candidatus Neomarinimicrobiota bacterium]
MINSNKINPYVSNLSITSIWSIGSFFVNLMPIYFLQNNVYAELIVCTTTIFLLNQVITLGLSDSILKYGNSALLISLLLILLNSLFANFFIDYKVVLGSLGLSSMITIRNYLIKNNIEHKIIKITFFIVLIRIIGSYLILKYNFTIESYIILLFLIPGLLISLSGLFVSSLNQNSFEIIIKKEVLFFAITTLLSRFLYSLSSRISIFVLNNQECFDEIKLVGFLFSFIGIYSVINQSIRNVLIGKVSSSIEESKKLFFKVVSSLKIFLLLNFIVSVVLSLIIYNIFDWNSFEVLAIDFSIIALIFLFFFIFGLLPFFGLFNVALRTLNRIDIEIFINILRLLFIFLITFYFTGIYFIYVYLIILFLSEIILAIISNKFLFKWKK